MKRYVFENAQGTVKVDYAVDNFGGKFTVSQIIGLSDAEQTFGLQFRQLAYNHSDFVTFATANNLKLSQQTPDATTVLVAVGTALAISNASSLTGGTDDVVYAGVTLTAVGGNGPYTYAVTTGSLPAGLTLSTGGVISGTPTAAGTSNFTVTATDKFGQTVAKAFSIVIS